MRLHARCALLPSGWARDVAIDIADDGRIARVEAGAAAGGESVSGPLVPGMPNLHSHAFQRAIAGRTGRPPPDGESDSFWSWRSAMYAFVGKVDADVFGAIAAQAYVEMLRAGYTSVAEFHYVHHDQRGEAYARPTELALRVAEAAQGAGIALTLLPTYYAHAGFGGKPPLPGQQRFVHSMDSFERIIAALALEQVSFGYTLGVAAHSLRAVDAREVAHIARLLPDAPVHIHAAEQRREVEDCVAALGEPPVAWLLGHAGVDQRWCLVHATHMTADETRGLAQSGAVAGLAPTTEADLGDGTFNARAYLAAEGAFGIGSDSNTVIDPYAELRQLEYSQRLNDGARNVLVHDGRPVGETLYARAAVGGAKALGQSTGAIAAGLRADLVVLDTADPALAGQGMHNVLDAAIFGPCRRPVRDVMVNGRWVVRDGRHPAQDAVLARYLAALAKLDGQ